MILLVHLLFGAAIGSAVKNIPLAIILAFLGHYFLDLFPHVEYDIENIGKKQWHKAMPDVLKILVDFCLGTLLIIIFSNNQPIIYICALLGALPDGFTVLGYIFPNKIFRLSDDFHKKIHFLKDKKISIFWRILSQITAILISILLFRF